MVSHSLTLGLSNKRQMNSESQKKVLSLSAILCIQHICLYISAAFVLFLCHMSMVMYAFKHLLFSKCQY